MKYAQILWYESTPAKTSNVVFRTPLSVEEINKKLSDFLEKNEVKEIKSVSVTFESMWRGSERYQTIHLFYV